MLHRKLSPTSDFKPEVLQDALAVEHTQSLEQQTSENLSRLIEKLMFGRELFRKELDRLNAAVKNASPQQQIPQKADWTDAAKGKLAFASAALGSLPILFFADQLITTAKKRINLLESVVRLGKWIEWILYFAGLSLTIYGLAKGIKIPGDSE
jgi:hypothetical protein